MLAPKNFAQLLHSIEDFALKASSFSQLQQYMVNRMQEDLPGYDWVGFYMMDPAEPSTLVLGPFAGEPTPHVRIPVTQGICGAAAATGNTIVVDDVAADPRYLACSIETKSEIVVPIWVDGTIVGEIDVDSHQPTAFGMDDKAFLEACASIAGNVFGR